jgi:hypothetical protein
MDMFLLWRAFLLWDIGMHRVQSAGETESEPPGYQTETRHIRAELERWDWWRKRGRNRDISGSVLSHAETAQWLRTSPPTDHKVNRIFRYFYCPSVPFYTDFVIQETYGTLNCTGKPIYTDSLSVTIKWRWKWYTRKLMSYLPTHHVINCSEVEKVNVHIFLFSVLDKYY